MRGLYTVTTFYFIRHSNKHQGCNNNNNKTVKENEFPFTENGKQH
uniref:Uncharacterized protein n=1 Tax=Anguilla anguilla TaxID=7936 RepID=A0A0E9RKN5_ANGAN